MDARVREPWQRQTTSRWRRLPGFEGADRFIFAPGGKKLENKRTRVAVRKDHFTVGRIFFAFEEELAEGPPFAEGKIVERPIVPALGGNLAPAFVKHCQFMATTLNFRQFICMAPKTPRRFDFSRDTFAFANELLWEYRFDAGKMSFCRREPRPDYAHRCFVLARAARQFLYHASFDDTQAIADEDTYHRLIRAVLSRNPRVPSQETVLIPGFAGLRAFSTAREKLLKATCGGAWRSYILRSHWRMVFPISREHQRRTAAELVAQTRGGVSPIVHLVKFPSLTINHGMIVFDATESETEIQFAAYDPNLPEKAATLAFQRAESSFYLPVNSYWAGGRLNIIEIFRSWIL